MAIDKSNEAMKLALEALEGLEALLLSMGLTHLIVYGDAEKAITNLQKALANEALDKMAENARELGLDYTIKQTGVGIGKPMSDHRLMEQPAQQMIHCKHRLENNGVCPHHNLHCGWPKCNEPEQPAQQEPVAIRLWDSQWVNVVNHDNCYQNWSKEDAINHAVKMTEKYIAENVANRTSPPAQRKEDK